MYVLLISSVPEPGVDGAGGAGVRPHHRRLETTASYTNQRGAALCDYYLTLADNTRRDALCKTVRRGRLS